MDGGAPYQITEQDFEAYVKEGMTWGADRVSSAERSARLWRLGGFAGMLCGVAGVFAAATVIARHTEHWSLLALDTYTHSMFMIPDSGKADLPDWACQWFLKYYVKMRESYDIDDDRSAFNGVISMSDDAEQMRYKTWHDSSLIAPRQILHQGASGHPYRVAEAITDPMPQGIGPDGGKKYEIRFHYQDFERPEHPSAGYAVGTAWFDATMRRADRTGPNICGIKIGHYTRQIDQEAPTR